MMDDYTLRKIAFLSDPEKALAEIRRTVARFSADFHLAPFEAATSDVKDLFEGNYPGYRASNTKYHDFGHTLSVVLATARLMHGCALDGYTFSARDTLLTLLAALFHDVGLIQEVDDLEGSGAKYTVGHEDRSILFMKNYLGERDFSSEEIERCGNCIQCTILNLPTSRISFQPEEFRVFGHIVGSADMLAQMADRMYLEKLLLLYKEFEEARLPGFDSALELLQKTKDFYEVVAKKRLYEELDGICVHMRSHYREVSGIDKDLYVESIDANIEYLESLIDECKDSFTCYLEKLRRGGIAKEILESLFSGGEG
jgi:hypothetical protein